MGAVKPASKLVAEVPKLVGMGEGGPPLGAWNSAALPGQMGNHNGFSRA